MNLSIRLHFLLLPFLLLLFLPLSVINADEVTSTSLTTEDLFVEFIGAKSMSFSGTNEFDFTGDGVDDQQLNYTLTIKTSDSGPLTPTFDDSGAQTGNLSLRESISPLLITYSIDGVENLPGADPAYDYQLVEAKFLGVSLTNFRNGKIIFADRSASTDYTDSASFFEMRRNGHFAAAGLIADDEYLFKASSEEGAQILEGLTHSEFTVRLIPVTVPEPGTAGCLLVITLAWVARRKRRF